MPSSITHYIFAQDVVSHLKKTPSFLVEQDNIDLCYLGAQGPDPLFFYGFIPWRKREDKKIINDVGTSIHAEDMANKFNNMIEYANSGDVNQKGFLYAFIYGALLHYVLDRFVHPFVFYRSGFQIDANDTYRYDIDHARYETYMDVSLLESLGTNPRKVRTTKIIRANPVKVSLVSEMYRFKEKSLPKTAFYESWRDMKTAEGILYDPSGFKKFLFRLFKMQKSLPYAMCHPMKIDAANNYDYLNLKKEMWKNPSTLFESKKSFFDLYEDARKDANSALKILTHAYEGKNFINDLVDFCYDLNYKGIIQGTNMVEYKSIFTNK